MRWTISAAKSRIGCHACRIFRLAEVTAASVARLRRFLMSARQALDQSDQLLRLVRFRDVMVEPGAAREGPVCRAVAAGDRDQRRLGAAVALAQLLRHLEAIHARQAD